MCPLGSAVDVLGETTEQDIHIDKGYHLRESLHIKQRAFEVFIIHDYLTLATFFMSVYSSKCATQSCSLPNPGKHATDRAFFVVSRNSSS